MCQGFLNGLNGLRYSGKAKILTTTNEGLLYFADNSGAVRQVTIRSRDPRRAGSIGLTITQKLPPGCHVKNLTVAGFNRNTSGTGDP